MQKGKLRPRELSDLPKAPQIEKGRPWNMKSGCLISESGLFPLFYAASCECLPGINFLPLKNLFQPFWSLSQRIWGHIITQATSAKSRQSQRMQSIQTAALKPAHQYGLLHSWWRSKESCINLATGSDEQWALLSSILHTPRDGQTCYLKNSGVHNPGSSQQHTESSVLVCSTVALWKGLGKARIITAPLKGIWLSRLSSARASLYWQVLNLIALCPSPSHPPPSLWCWQ